MKKVLIMLSVFLIMALVAGSSFMHFASAHTFTISDLTSEQIQPVLGTVRVSGTEDTDVWFIDVDEPSVRYQIGYITPGMSEKIKLEKGRWYKVQADGEITIRMINIRKQ